LRIGHELLPLLGRFVLRVDLVLCIQEAGLRYNFFVEACIEDV
jgi:hypothetical protein